MDSNKDEAEKCIELAEKYMKEENKEYALKFLQKAEQLYPSQKAKDLLAQVDLLAPNGAPNVPQTPPEEQEQQQAEFTIHQAEAVERIKNCKNYYEILEVGQNATDSDIRKAYKKLALQLHPDKNWCPGAPEAFKAVSNAVAILSDIESRNKYNNHGQTDLFNNKGPPGGQQPQFQQNMQPKPSPLIQATYNKIQKLDQFTREQYLLKIIELIKKNNNLITDHDLLKKATTFEYDIFMTNTTLWMYRMKMVKLISSLKNGVEPDLQTEQKNAEKPEPSNDTMEPDMTAKKVRKSNRKNDMPKCDSNTPDPKIQKDDTSSQKAHKRKLFQENTSEKSDILNSSDKNNSFKSDKLPKAANNSDNKTNSDKTNETNNASDVNNSTLDHNKETPPLKTHSIFLESLLSDKTKSYNVASDLNHTKPRDPSKVTASNKTFNIFFTEIPSDKTINNSVPSNVNKKPLDQKIPKTRHKTINSDKTSDIKDASDVSKSPLDVRKKTTSEKSHKSTPDTIFNKTKDIQDASDVNNSLLDTTKERDRKQIKTEIGRLVAKLLTPAYQENRFSSKDVFKNVARSITHCFIDRDESQLKRFVKSFLKKPGLITIESVTSKLKAL